MNKHNNNDNNDKIYIHLSISSHFCFVFFSSKWTVNVHHEKWYVYLILHSFFSGLFVCFEYLYCYNEYRLILHIDPFGTKKKKHRWWFWFSFFSISWRKKKFPIFFVKIYGIGYSLAWNEHLSFVVVIVVVGHSK